MDQNVPNPAEKNLTRRDLLRKASQSGLTLAAASALSPFVLSGCGGGGSGNKIKVGILHSLSGVMEISEKSLRDAEVMAIEEINEKGGVLGKKIEYIVEDPKSQMDTGFPDKAKKLLQQDKVAAVFGCWTSSSRKAVLPVFEKNNGLLFYPVQYEGNECSKNVVYTGAAPNQQIIPAVEYMWDKMGRKKFYLLGSDYIFPRTANKVLIALLKEKYKVDPVAEKYVPMDQKDFKNVVDDIKKLKPDAILSTINGDSNLPFYREMATNKITAEEMPICAFSVAEDELRGLKDDAASMKLLKGHLAAWNYFQSIKRPENESFIARFQAKYGKDRVTDDPIEAAYFQVYFWKLAVEKAGSIDVDKVREAVRGIEFDAPGGKKKVDPKNQHTWKPFLMGEIQEDGQFKILFETPEWVRPDPYPQIAFPGQDCDWSKGGDIKTQKS